MSEMEEEEEDAEWEMGATAAAIIWVGAEEARKLHAERRKQSRLYLCRPQLLPNPRYNTPWQVLHASGSDCAFITTMGFDCQTFHGIIKAGFDSAWYSTPIPRNDVRTTGQPRPGAQSLDAEGALGLISLQQIFALIPTTVSCYITFGLSILLMVLRKIPNTAIRWPGSVDEFQSYNDLIVEHHPRLTGAFTSVDGLNLPGQTAEDEEMENATYNGWLCEHFISSAWSFSECILSCLTIYMGTVIAAKLNAPGSWHDSRVAKPIYEKLRTRTPEGFYVVADTAFPRGTAQIDGRIRTTAEIEEKLAFDPEWGMSGLQGSFGRLRLPLDIGDQDERGNLLEICVRLHNLRAQCVGYNQIRTVYMPLWRQNKEDIEVWTNFENMLFSEQRRVDRVSRFHNFPEYE
ncbi:hypothetical protein DFH07DRAFT_864357 [Mycena maculata]|uniref:DDE Tnp4 domain-containing protein n=1 Tax=Mycena maculata TaxID=230809 RepID=A0AAD7P2M9_9AGAR|nr:hypothetical protein DFH07DRAFT_864357 [Mycena maculata]